MKIAKKLSLIIIILFILMMNNGLIIHYARGGQQFPLFKKALQNFSKFPFTIYQALSSSSVSGIPDTYIKKNINFEELNTLDYNLFGLNSFWVNNQWEIRLINFMNDSLIYRWNIEENDYLFRPEKPVFSHKLPRHSALLKNKELIVQLAVSPNLMRIDSSSNIKWVNQDMVFHHSVNFDSDSNLWVCAFPRDSDFQWDRASSQVKINDGTIINYDDDYIVKIDPSNGELLFKKSVSEILFENNFQGLVFGQILYDPIHLNDIEPVLKTTKYWDKGDLFLSIRNRSLIIHYRPSVNKIIKIINGPFINQHDIDIISETEISIFNNNAIFPDHYSIIATENKNLKHWIKSSEILIYDYKTNHFRSQNKELFEKEKIFTSSEGLCEFLSNGDIFVESQNNGQLYIIRDNQLILKKVFKSPINEYIHSPNWIRIYENLNFNN